jgi:hypothetical protein
MRSGRKLLVSEFLQPEVVDTEFFAALTFRGVRRCNY